MKKTRLTLEEAGILFPSFLKPFQDYARGSGISWGLRIGHQATMRGYDHPK